MRANIDRKLKKIIHSASINYLFNRVIATPVNK